VNGDS
jgi:hypothetical protein